MTTLTYLNRHAIPTAFALLPIGMGSPQARAMMLAIALQESKAAARKQRKGPARGFYQFEEGGGVKGVLTHRATKTIASDVLNTLSYAPWTVTDVYEAITHNDVLASVFARLLLWTDAESLPNETDPSAGWRIYLRTWRPGKPHPHTWVEHFTTAWDLAGG